MLFCGACTRDSGWEGRPVEKPGLNKVRLQMAGKGTSRFESYIHSLAVYAFVEPAVGSTGDFGYLPFPDTGIQKAYFMSNVQVKPGTGTNVSLFVILDRVVCRLTVVLSDLPDTIDTVRYRVSGLASRLTLDEKATGDTISVSGVYTRERAGASATDTVIDRLMLFPALRSQAGLRLTFSSGSTVVREKQVTISGLIQNNDVYITGRWESELTALVRLFSNLSCSSPRSND